MVYLASFTEVFLEVCLLSLNKSEKVFVVVSITDSLYEILYDDGILKLQICQLSSRQELLDSVLVVIFKYSGSKVGIAHALAYLLL